MGPPRCLSAKPESQLARQGGAAPRLTWSNSAKRLISNSSLTSRRLACSVSAGRQGGRQGGRRCAQDRQLSEASLARAAS